MQEIMVDNPDAPAVHGRAAVIGQWGALSDTRGYEHTYGRVMIWTRRFPFSAVPRVARAADTHPTGVEALMLRNPITT